MEGGSGDDNNDDDDDRCEYVTLRCRRSATGGCGGDEAKMHVKVWFYDDRAAATDRGDGGQTAVLRVQGVVVGGVDATDVYEGRVTGRQVKSATTDGDDVRRWLGHARHALVGRRDGDDAVEYSHCLERVPGADDERGRPAALVLAWKQKLRSFVTVTRGSVRLCRVTGGDGVPDRVCRLFVEPLFDRLHAARLRAERAERAAAEDSQRLLADNGRLLDELRSVADRRRLDDARLTAKFLEVLNAKKSRLAAVRQELSELKERRRRDDDDDVPAAVVRPEKDNVCGRGGGKNARRRGGKRGTTVVDSANAKRGRELTTADARERAYGHCEDRATTPECSIRSPMPSNVDTVTETQQVTYNQQQEMMETDECPSAVVMANPVSAHNDKNVVDFDVFEADTQIDDDPSSSPSFFQQIPSTPLTEADALPLDDKKIEHHKNKSFLDDLWQGIL